MRLLFLAMLLVSVEVHAKEYQFVAIDGLVEQDIGKMVLPKIYQKLGIKVSIASLPARKAENELSLGFNDGEVLRIHSYGNNNERVVRVPTPYYKVHTMVFTHKNDDIVVNDIDALKNYRVAVVKGVKHTDTLTQFAGSVVVLQNSNQILKLLDQGKVDIALTNTIDGMVTIQKLGLKNVEAALTPLATEELYHYMHKSHADMVPKVDKVIRDMIASGELKMLIRQAELSFTAAAQ